MPDLEDPLRGRTLIGIAERIDLPAWGVKRMRAKIDTGARTSSLHVDDVEELSGDRVRFTVVLDRRRPHRRVSVEAPVARRASVRSSSGKGELRIFVTTRMRIGPVEREIEITLASRGPMLFRMLLGRTALGHDFVIDPSHRYLLPRPSGPRQEAKSKNRHREGGTPSPPAKSEASATTSPQTSKKARVPRGAADH